MDIQIDKNILILIICNYLYLLSKSSNPVRLVCYLFPPVLLLLYFFLTREQMSLTGYNALGIFLISGFLIILVYIAVYGVGIFAFYQEIVTLKHLVPDLKDLVNTIRNWQGIGINWLALVVLLPLIAHLNILIGVLVRCSPVELNPCTLLASPFPDREELGKIHELKGTSDINETLQPLVIKTKNRIQGVWEVNRRNCLAALNEDGDFALLTIDKKGRVRFKPAQWGFPRAPRRNISACPNSTFIWGVMNPRSFYIADLETRLCREGGAGTLASHIRYVTLVDPGKKLFMIISCDSTINDYYRIRTNRKPDLFYQIYDFINDELGERSDFFDGDIYPLGNGRFLSELWNQTQKKYEWFISNYDFSNRETNELTQKLNSMKITLARGRNLLNPVRRQLIGVSSINVPKGYYSVQWNEDFSEVSVKPLQLGNKENKSRSFFISRDGNWIKSVTYGGVPPHGLNRLMLYHSSRAYPQGVSPPITCGFSSDDISGAFFEHSEWGTCYVEPDKNTYDKLFVYRGTDALKWLAGHKKSSE